MEKIPTAPAAEDHIYYSTRSICPECHQLVPGQVVAREDKVYVSRNCDEHGFFEGLICSDRAYYENLERFTVEGIKPQNPGPKTVRGCPEDCGLCGRHLQIAGTAAMEISNSCNAKCPTCLAQNQTSFELEPEDVQRELENLLKNQSYVDVFTLSGGEPTIHPKLFEILDLLNRPEVGRIVINSNGIRIANDAEFVRQLAEKKNVYVCLHFDGDEAKTLRGIEHRVQQKALDQLSAHGIDVVPLVLAAKGVNEQQLGSLVTSLLGENESVKAIHLSMMTHTGSGGSHFSGDPLTRLTIPEALNCIELGSGGRIKQADFIPFVMPNPLCASIGYFLVMDGEITPLIPLGETDEIIEYVKNGSFGQINPSFEGFIRQTIDRVYADGGDDPECQKLLAKFKRVLKALFPSDSRITDAERLKKAEQYIKTVVLLQFMDPWTFDAKRLQKCSCQHLLPGGNITPSCGYYSYHRLLDSRFDNSEGAGFSLD
jgi:7,8-dihydro-6-hydroxymethylpterin dimethyltransferase